MPFNDIVTQSRKFVRISDNFMLNVIKNELMFNYYNAIKTNLKF